MPTSRHADAVLPSIAAARRRAILVGGTGLYPAPWRAASPSTRLPRTRRSGADSRPTWRDGLPPLVARLRALAPRLAARTDLAQPPPRRPRAGDRRASRRPAPAGAARLPGPVLLDRPRRRRPRSTAMDRPARRGPVRRRAPATRRSPCAPATIPTPGLQRVRLPRGLGRPRRRARPDAAIGRDAGRNVAFARRQRTWFRREPADRGSTPADPAAGRRAVDGPRVRRRWPPGGGPRRDQAPADLERGRRPERRRSRCQNRRVPDSPRPVGGRRSPATPRQEVDAMPARSRSRSACPQSAAGDPPPLAVDEIPRSVVALPRSGTPPRRSACAGRAALRALPRRLLRPSSSYEAGVPLAGVRDRRGRWRVEPVVLPGGELAVAWHVGPVRAARARPTRRCMRWIGERDGPSRDPMWEVYSTDPGTRARCAAVARPRSSSPSR